MTQIIKFQNEVELKSILANQYMKQINNYFGDDKRALRFLSGVISAVQRNRDLLNCESASVINSFMTMAQLGLMPSDVSGEAYVIPYKGKAQFQLGYQGLVTLFYRAGGQSIRAEIVREKDDFTYENGVIRHKIDIFKSNEERGEPIGAYAIALVNGHEISKAMNKKDILIFGAQFSKSFTSEYSPWNPKNDPELTMWKKTVLKQLGKLLPKNETINRAIAEDNKDSVISDRLESAQKESESLKMGNALKYAEDQNSADKEAENTVSDAAGGQASE